MSASVVSPRARNWARATALAAITLAISGCSDSGRFEANNPFASTKPNTPPADVTGSVSSKPASSKIASQPLPAPTKPATVASTGVAQGAGGLGTYRPSDVTGSVPAPVGHWTWEGGTPIVVGADENVEAIGRKYGVPASAIMQANNITNSSAIRPGQRLVIPRYVSSAAATTHPQPAPTHPQPAPAKPVIAAAHATPAPAPEYVHTVKPGESLIA